jgi:hypothetical protein
MMSKISSAGLGAFFILAACQGCGSSETAQSSGTDGSGGQSAKGGSSGDSSGSAGGSSTSSSRSSSTGGSSKAGSSSSSSDSGSSGGAGATGGKSSSTSATGGASSTGGGGQSTGGGTGGGGTTSKGGSTGGTGTGTKTETGGTGGRTSGGGATSSGGMGGGGTTSVGGTPVPSACGLPPGPNSGVAKPSGSGTKLDVLPWAGFKAATSFSLDDGNTSQIQNYNTLNGMGVKLTFYLVTGWSNTNDAIWKQAIKDGHEIGNHTQSHSCGTASQGESDIKSKFGVTAYTLAAPNGDTSCGSSVDSLNLLLNRGVNGGTISFTADDSSIAKNLPTNLPASGASASALTGAIDGAYNKGEWQTFCIHGFTGDGNAYQPIPLSSLTDAVKTEKQKKDLWIDTMQAVGAYWRAGRAFAKATKTTSGGDTSWKWTVGKNMPPNTCLRVKPDGGVVKQNGVAVPWDDHGYYEISFNAGEVTLSAQ